VSLAFVDVVNNLSANLGIFFEKNGFFKGMIA
jgi:hypothetical protein